MPDHLTSLFLIARDSAKIEARHYKLPRVIISWIPPGHFVRHGKGASSHHYVSMQLDNRAKLFFISKQSNEGQRVGVQDATVGQVKPVREGGIAMGKQDESTTRTAFEVRAILSRSVDFVQSRTPGSQTIDTCRVALYALLPDKTRRIENEFPLG